MGNNSEIQYAGGGRFWWAVVVVVMFCLALASPTIAIWAGYQNTFAVTERRDPAAFPGWPSDAETSREFPDGCEHFANDNFGLRSQLVRMNNYLRFLIGISGSDRVLVGKEGWLFLGAKNLVNDYRAITPPRTSAVDRWFRRMNQRSEFLTQHGIDMLIVVVPNKHSIYPEYMPRHVTRSGNPGALDTLLELRPSRGPNLRILDLRPVLMAKKSDYRVYHRTDSHWNALGAFFGSDAIVRTLEEKYSTLSPLELSDFEFTEKQLQGMGNARMLGISDLQSESGIYLKRKFTSRIVTRDELDDYHPVRTEVITTNLHDAPSVFIIGDSFLQTPKVYLEQSFSKTVTVDRRGRGFDEEFILQEKPDIVIFETVERNLFQETQRD